MLLASGLFNNNRQKEKRSINGNEPNAKKLSKSIEFKKCP